MKKIAFFTFTILLLLFPISFVQASSVQNFQLGTSVVGNLTTDAQTATYEIDLPSSGTISIRLTSPLSCINMDLTDDKNNTITSESFNRDDQNSGSHTYSVDLASGKYYLTVNGNGSIDRYDLTINFESGRSNDIEPNDDISTAQEITSSNNLISGFIAWNNDTNIYKFTIYKDEIKNISFCSFIGDVNFQLSDANGTSIISKEITGGSSQQSIVYKQIQKLTSGTYYIKITKNNSSTGRYYFTINTLYNNSGWTFLDTSWYYLKADGTLQTGWLYYKNNWYYLDKDGAMSIGLTKIGDNWYYLDGNGIMKTGWVFTGTDWYYFKNNGTSQKGWILYKSKWYYMDNDGRMLTGLQDINASIYYLDNNGIMKTGWIFIDNSWYYFNKNGTAQTDWLYYNNNWYNFDYSGEMLTGAYTIDSEEYYFDNSGIMKTGWILFEGYWYYFNENGSGKEGWLSYGGHWYFLHYEYGYMVTGYWNIDGIDYHFDSNGVMIY